MMERMRRQRPFLDSLLREAKPLKRQVLLEHANKDQINLVSELVLNTLRNKVPVSPVVFRTLKRHKELLRTLARRKTSLKRRRELLAKQTGGGFWKGLDCCYRQCRV